MKKFVLFLATKKGYISLKGLIENKFTEYIGCIVSFREINVEISYDIMIKKLCIENNIDFYLWKDFKNICYNCILERRITSAVAIGWKYLIDLKINELLEDNLMVFHDSLLPKYRGFAPTSTAIICGEENLGVTVIFATTGVDEGNIILQQNLRISEKEYISEIIEKQGYIYLELLIRIFNMTISNELFSYKQNSHEATYSLWRNEEDCKIDWSKTDLEIYNLVRAVSTPYYGAYTFYRENKIIIEKCERLDYNFDFVIRDYGKIWSIENNQPIVVCGIGLIKIIHARNLKNEKVIFNKLRYKLQ